MLSVILLSLETKDKRTKFETIYNVYHQKMLNIAFGITKDQYDAEDALHSALLIIAEHIDNVDMDNPDMLKSYLYKIVKNAAIDIVRKKHKEPILVDINNYVSFDENIVCDDSIIDYISYKELTEIIINMPDTYRDVLILHYLHDFSVTKIALLLKRNLGTVKSQLTRGNKLLLTALKEKKND